MTNPDYTALQFIIDRSGSMLQIYADMQGGIATLLREQAKVGPYTTVDVVYFDDEFTYPVVGQAPEDVQVRIEPRGMTALYDAIVKGTRIFGERLAGMSEENRPGKVIVAIVTDGYENASRENTSEDVKNVITEQRDKYGWEFMFLGANQDAIQTAGAFGIRSQDAFTYAATSAGVADMTRRWSDHTTAYRSGVVDHDINAV